jgi:hypothetical protein
MAKKRTKGQMRSKKHYTNRATRTPLKTGGAPYRKAVHAPLVVPVVYTPCDP